MAILKKRKLFYEERSGQVKCIDIINQYIQIDKELCPSNQSSQDIYWIRLGLRTT